MLTLIENMQEKIAAQNKFESLVRREWAHREDRLIIWRPDSTVLPVAHNKRWWFASAPPRRGQKTPRYWNSIGEYRGGNKGLVITVEINIPTKTNSKAVSGFFAKDSVTGDIFLMHDGGIGGGRPGIGKSAFLAWTGALPVPVMDSKEKIRFGLIVSPLNDKLGAHLERFATSVRDFKAAAASGDVHPEDVEAASSRFRDYYQEFSGKKRGTRAAEFEYTSRHGEVVDTVAEWRCKALRAQQTLKKNTFVDLAVLVGDDLKEIYEVKTSMARQVFYTAIGQVLVHEAEGRRVKRFLVVPDEGAIYPDIETALQRLKIEVLKYRIDGRDRIRFPA